MINQDKNLKVALITKDGQFFAYYDGEIRDKDGEVYDMHHDVLYGAIHKDFSENRRLVKKSKKCQGQNMELIHLMLDQQFCVIYDTTNYHNYRPYKDHTGVMMLPSHPKQLSRAQQITLLKLSKEMPMNLDHIRYDENNHLPFVTYDTLQVSYRNKKGEAVLFGDINNLIEELTGYDIQLEESKKR